MKEIIISVLFGILGASVLLAVLPEKASDHLLGNFSTATVIGAATTTASFAVTTSARVLATTTNTVGTGYTRAYATICTTSATPVVLNLDNDKAANLNTGNYTAVIAAAAGYNACYEITDRNQYSGSITASSTNQTSTVIQVKDYVQ